VELLLSEELAVQEVPQVLVVQATPEDLLDLTEQPPVLAEESLKIIRTLQEQ
jgi:hypothetical protein